MVWIFFLAFFISTSYASDLMNLNEFMPTRLEDASPVDEHEWQMQLTSVFNEDGDNDQALHLPNVRYGLNDRAQLEAFHTIKSGGDETGNGDIYLGGQYQFNESQDWSPVFALEPFMILSTGEHSRGEDFSYKFLVSTALRGTPQKPITQFHFNFQQIYNDDPRPAERTNRFSYAVGMSERLNHLTVLVMDVIFQEEIKKWQNSNFLELGFIRLLGDNFNLGAGAGLGLGENSPSWTANLSLEKEF